MPRYVFHLHDGPTTEPVEEVVEAVDDAEARALADIRLLLSASYTHVRVSRDGQERFRIKRDSQDDLPALD